jgi:hypothetical protein
LVEEKSPEFKEMTHVGSVFGSEVKRLREWLINEFTVSGAVTFDMWSVYDDTTEERILASRNCHDFVEIVLQQLKFVSNISPWDDGNRPNRVSVFRDSLALSAQSFVEMDMKNAKKRRDFLRFLRFLKNHVYEAARDLGMSKFPATKLQMLGMRFVVHADGEKYYEIELGEINSLNYCRLALEFELGKPVVAVPLNDPRKECYLPYFEMARVHEEATYHFQDYLLAFEQKVDDLLFGRDGNGGALSDQMYFVFESTIIVLALTKGIMWISKRNNVSI